MLPWAWDWGWVCRFLVVGEESRQQLHLGSLFLGLMDGWCWRLLVLIFPRGRVVGKHRRVFSNGVGLNPNLSHGDRLEGRLQGVNNHSHGPRHLRQAEYPVPFRLARLNVRSSKVRRLVHRNRKHKHAHRLGLLRLHHRPDSRLYLVSLPHRLARIGTTLIHTINSNNTPHPIPAAPQLRNTPNSSILISYILISLLHHLIHYSHPSIISISPTFISTLFNPFRLLNTSSRPYQCLLHLSHLSLNSQPNSYPSPHPNTPTQPSNHIATKSPGRPLLLPRRCSCRRVVNRRCDGLFRVDQWRRVWWEVLVAVWLGVRWGVGWGIRRCLGGCLCLGRWRSRGQVGVRLQVEVQVAVLVLGRERKQGLELEK